MSDVLISSGEAAAPIPLVVLAGSEAAAWLEAAPSALRAWAAASGFKAKPGQLLKAPGADGGLEQTMFVVDGAQSLGAQAQAFRALAVLLPPGDHVLSQVPAGLDPTEIATAFAQGAYRFDRYKADRAEVRPRLVAPPGADLAAARQIAHACTLARDMVNTPANDLGPLQIETIAREIAEAFGADVKVTVGDELLAANFPAVHAVGRAAAPHRAPRMIELSWGDESHPLVAIVGKGVVFDTGGLDIKPSSGMALMKKDMGGAAHALALARMVMAANLKVRVCVLIPAVENAISGDAMRPGDVIGSRKGLSIEVGNTDAEGRLILADALARAAELEPALTIDMATLTGAARVAVGPQIAPFYTDDDDLARDLESAAATAGDPVWRMPLWRGYAPAIDSEVADLKNDPDGWAQAGSITAALFLQRFAPACPWLHFDIYAWNAKARPGWPSGAEAQAVRALLRLLKVRYG